MLNKVPLEQIKIQYVDLLKTVKSFPLNSPYRKKAREELSEYLKSVKHRFGQEIVDKISGKTKPKPIEPTMLVVCEFCGANVGSKNLKHHIKKRHNESQVQN